MLRNSGTARLCLRALALHRWARLCALLFALWPARSFAEPVAPELFCNVYPTIPDCEGKIVNCAECHVSVAPVIWNGYGQALLAKLSSEVSFEQALPDAVHAIEQEDSDGDGLTNLRELMLGTMPGDASSGWSEPPAPMGAENPRFDVGNYDYRFAYRRVSILYCGQSPSYDELQALSTGRPDAATLRQRVHDKLSACLNSPYWSQTALPRLADKRIRPLAAAGPDTQVKIGPFRLVIGDYNYDYRMWRYLLTGDRDMRELLTARYHVVEAADGALTQVTGPLDKSDPSALAGGQPLSEDQRAGMITTQWFLAINTMFSGLPRTTAAQAYRSYLGADITSLDGIRPVPGEPADIDDKGVDDARCAICHSTLDPLAYAFAKYEGIDAMYNGGGFGGYRPERVARTMPRWDDAVQRPVLFGQYVSNLVEWAQVAAASDMFKRNMAELFFEHALSRAPTAGDLPEFTALWMALPADGYSANRMLHRLIDTRAFGVP